MIILRNKSSTTVRTRVSGVATQAVIINEGTVVASLIDQQIKVWFTSVTQPEVCRLLDLAIFSGLDARRKVVLWNKSPTTIRAS